MKRHTIIGTAGHIDHGKTALIKALTGIDADRLKEEKDRGITIDLGFAYWRDDVTIIDVPGHEKFIRNMVAGVSTIDFFILVIAADDGIMPQTIEHLEILNFFNIDNGIIAINKSDLADQEWLDLISEEINGLLKGYGLHHLPIVTCSAQTGHNIDILRDEIENKISQLEEITSSRPFRLPIDRSFSIKGFGTVVTGTVLSGNLRKGDEVSLLPANRLLKVRGIQTHTSDVEEVAPGFRAAVNLQGIGKEDIIRGDVICQSKSLMPVTEFTGVLKTVSKIPISKIPNHCQIHAYIGTSECPGELIWYDDRRYLRENQTYHVRIKLHRPLTAARGDAFLVRLHSPVITLAGGKILEVNPNRIRHKETEWVNYFEQMSSEDLTELVEAVILQSGLSAVSLSLLQKKFFEDISTLSEIVTELAKRKKIRSFKIKKEIFFVHEKSFNELLEDILDFLAQYHTKMAYKPGINQTELINAMDLAWVLPEIIESAITKLVNSREIRLDQNLIAKIDFKIKMSKDSDEVRHTVLSRLEKSGFAPPTPSELAQEIEVSQDEIKTLMSMLTKENLIIIIQRDFYLHHITWHRLLEFLKNYFSKYPEMQVSALKDFIQTTRKYAIPLFEYLDSEGYTERSGDVRRKGYKL
jgi:selenocysteine-specific elongation factor